MLILINLLAFAVICKAWLPHPHYFRTQKELEIDSIKSAQRAKLAEELSAKRQELSTKDEDDDWDGRQHY